MHRPALRTLLGRRPELARAAVGGQSCQATARPLSTTSSLRADEQQQPKTTGGGDAKPAGRPTPRQRSAEAASLLSALGKYSSNKSDAATAAPSRSLDARSLGASAGTLSTSNNIINVRSLPRARGGNSPPGPSGVTAPGRFRPGGSNTFSRRPPGTGGARAGAGAGRRPGGARGGGAGGRGRRRGKGRSDEDRGRDPKGGKLVWTAEQQKWLDGVQQGIAAPYTPTLTLESLIGHGPATASAAAAPLSHVETALRGMRLVAGGEAYCADVRNPAQTKASVEQASERPVFFHDVAERAAFGGKDLKDKPSEEVQKAILRNMFEGAYTDPKFAAAADTLATVQNYHDRDVTYQRQDVKAFGDKVRALLPKQKAAAAPGGGKAGKGKQAKA